MSHKYKITIKNADMADFMIQDAQDIIIGAFEETSIEKDVASIIKKEFDKKFSQNWHCIVGKSFGTAVSYESRNYAYFNVNDHSVLLYKAG
ncbi:hypothetical protein CYY_002244 [Polysphondylium violaceum]|uniref:Dynein light chain n=1 Tax=Polysphondylium violaceum TaxID=133409 RepID=A0A8J4UVC1_9MYCE|nr:hypothetical protein CYY_002244 [Polysphondylium violaceum]